MVKIVKKKESQKQDSHEKKQEKSHDSNGEKTQEIKHVETKTKQENHDDGKTIAIISYLTWIGLLIAFIMNNEKKDEFAKFHIRQSLLLTLLGIALSFVFWLPLIGWALSIAFIVFWIMGLISAINGEEKELPVIGKYAQEWFKGL
ncbi:MAG: hypothetical protein QXE31_02415 [Candidatus Woesearchaeota archaeon]